MVGKARGLTNAKPSHTFSGQLFEVLFDQMPLGMVILDPDYQIVQFNATWASYISRYQPDTLSLLQPGCDLFSILPLARPSLNPLLMRAALGQTVREQAVCIATARQETFVNIMAMPLTEKGAYVGILLIGMNVTQEVIAQQELQLALQSLQRSHEEIERRVEERTQELTTLIKVQQALTSTLHLNDVLEMIVREARRLTHTDIGAVFLPDDEGLSLVLLSSEYPVNIAPGYHISLMDSITGTAFRTGQTQLVTDISTHAHVDPNAIEKASLRSLLSIPLVSGGKSIGVLSVGNKVRGNLGKEDERLLQMMAPAAVIALENVRRYEQASEMAVAAERGRLARDLHDAVTQTLFSASLTAEVLPRIWERNPAEGMKRVEKLRELTRGALAEMRTLLLELRPTALAEMALGDLLHQLAEGIAGRASIAIDVTIEGDVRLPNDVKFALYRIAQEALNNVARHAKAQRAQVTLHQTSDAVRLIVVDDGAGFDFEAARPNHLGLRIMAERVESIGADLKIDSAPGRGTRIDVHWHSAQGAAHDR